MEVDKILADLREELATIDSAIVAMEKLAVSKGGKKRGRPPKWLVEARSRKESDAEATPSARKVKKKVASRAKKKPTTSSK